MSERSTSDFSLMMSLASSVVNFYSSTFKVFRIFFRNVDSRLPWRGEGVRLVRSKVEWVRRSSYVDESALEENFDDDKGEVEKFILHVG